MCKTRFLSIRYYYNYESNKREKTKISVANTQMEECKDTNTELQVIACHNKVN